MNSLRIQQGFNVEIVSAQLIEKLYNTALSVPEPQDGEADAAYISGNLQVVKASRKKCNYLTNRFPNLSINVTGVYYVDFEDPEVERVLMANKVASDGINITETDVTNLNLNKHYFQGNTTITSFNEYGLFTTANGRGSGDVGYKFKDCVNLSEIDMSEVTVMHGYDFYNIGITTINAPKLTYTNGSYYAYSWAGYNSKLTTVTSLGYIQNIPEACFKRCDKLTTVNIPNTCTEIGKSAFAQCSLLSSIDLSNITTIGQQAFEYCTNLNNIILPNIQTVGQLSFRRSDNQQNRVIDCGPNLTSWSGDQFGDDKKVTLILRGSSIPSMIQNFSNREYWDTTIYVPRDMIAVYKADTDGWGRIQGRDGREVFYALEDSIYANTNWYQQQ